MNTLQVKAKKQAEHMVKGVLHQTSQIRKHPTKSGNQGFPLGYKRNNFPNQDPVEHP